MQVELPDTIQKYQLKEVAGLTKRQVMFLALAIIVFLALSFLSVLFLPSVFGKVIGIVLAALIVVPILIVGFYQYMGLTAGELLRRMLRQSKGQEYRPYRREDQFIEPKK